MTPTQVNHLFQSYTDESDRTFLTDPQIGLYLAEAYTQFRSIVCNVDPFIYSIQHLFTLTDSNIYDLAGNPPQLLGPAAVAGTKLERLLRVARINDPTQNEVLQWLEASPSQKGITMWGYTFVKSSLILASNATSSFRMEYIPFHDVNFELNGLAAISTYIDDLDGFHELIALLAYSRYAIRDGADNVQLLQSVTKRSGELQAFLQHGRSREGSSYVHDQSYSGNF
jgi:hypothetical protein